MKNEWKNKWIAAGIAAVAMAVVISGVFLFLRSGRQMSVKDAYYIQDGEMVSSEGRWRLIFDKNKGTTLKGHGVRKNLTDDGTVVYYKLENKVLLPQTDCLQFAAEDKIYRLEYFSTVELVEGGGYRIKDGSTSVVVPGGIIYDGKDTYLFLEPVKLTVDGEVTDLPALSMIHATYGNAIEIYPYGYEPSEVALYTDSDVKVTFSEGRTLMPLTDRVLLENQGWQLMCTSYQMLPRINTWED